MKTLMKNIFFVSAFLLLSMSIHAQDWAGYRVGVIYPGYIIKTDGTKIEGYLEAQDKATSADSPFGNSNQSRVVFFTDPKDKKSKVIYKPEDLTEYQIADKTYRSINYSGGLISKPLRFVLLVKDGEIAQYCWYEKEGNYPNINVTEKEVFQKKGGKTFDGTVLIGFAKKMSEIVSDYPELSQKIANHENGYSAANIYNIIEEYNKWALSQE